MVLTCLTEDGAVCPYGVATRKMAKQIVWPELKLLNDNYGLGCEFKEVELICTFPRGGQIQLFGLETIAEADKLRGLKFRKFLVDECQAIRPDVLEYLKQEVLDAALMDCQGQLIFTGTPGKFHSGQFFEATAPDLVRRYAEREGKDLSEMTWSRPWSDRNTDEWRGKDFTWSLHHWTLRDNVALPHLWGAALDIKKRNGWSDTNPKWRREFLGEWTTDLSGKVYLYEEGRNTWSPSKGAGLNEWGLPKAFPWSYIAGLDMGYTDPFALVVWAYSDNDPNLYQVYEYKEAGLSTDDMLERIEDMQRQFRDKLDIIVGDPAGSGRAVFESWAEHGVYVEPAQKRDKRDYIELFNADLLEGRIRLLKDGDLAHEMTHLTWWMDSPVYMKGGYEVGRNQHDHCCDAGLYVWRHAMHHFWKRIDETPKYNKDPEAYWDKRDEEESEVVREPQPWWEEAARPPGSAYVDFDGEELVIGDGFDPSSFT